MRCDRGNPQRQCEERRRAIREGRFFFAWNANYKGAWIWRGAKSNPWTNCPWCGSDLPTLEDVALRLMDGTCWWEDE